MVDMAHTGFILSGVLVGGSIGASGGPEWAVGLAIGGAILADEFWQQEVGP